jgi:regulator of RNase E activity RraB
MGLRDMFAGKAKRFVTEEDVRRKMAKQAEANTEILGRLAELAGVSSEDQFRVEYFFYTDTVTKAKALADDLLRLGYEVEQRPSTHSERHITVTGWTTPLCMSEQAIDGWTGHMFRLGLKYDCDFDGWGYES